MQAIDEMVTGLAAYYETTPVGLMEGLLILEYSLVWKELIARSPLQKAVTGVKQLGLDMEHGKAVDFCKAQVRPFCSLDVAEESGEDIEAVKAMMMRLNWPRLFRSDGKDWVWLPLAQ